MLKNLLIMLFTVACSTVPFTERELPDLTVEEIDAKIDEAAAIADEKVMYDEETWLREKNLIPDEVMNHRESVKSLREYVPQKSLTCRTLPSSVDLRKYDTGISRQWNGTCTAFSYAASLENFLCKHYKWCEKFSERHQWSNQLKNCRQPYSSHCSVLTGKKYRIAEEKYWPQFVSIPQVPDINKVSKVKLVDAPYIGDDVKKMQCYLSKGYPVILAMKTPLSMLNCDDVINPYSNPSSGGHAISIVGYKVSEKYGVMALIKNSWGRSCGMGGYQFVPTSIFFRHGYYASMWPITNVSLKGDVLPEPEPTPEPVNPGPVDPRPTPQKKCVEYKKEWCGGTKWYKLYLPWKKCKKCVKWVYQ